MSQFTFEEYEDLLVLAKSKYTFLQYKNYQNDQPGIYWRHDLDLSLDAALKMAQIESRHGIQSTYFIYPHCRFYSFLEKDSVRKIKTILSLGHHLGLHFDQNFYGSSDFSQALSQEKIILEMVLDNTVSVFSFHDPSAELIKKAEDLHDMVNTYNSYFREQVSYVSDSRGCWRYKTLKQVLDEQPAKLQVLTHPGWWTETSLDPLTKLNHIIESRAQSVKEMIKTEGGY